MRTLHRMLLLIAALSLPQGCMLNQPRASGTQSATTEHFAASPVAVESRNGSVEVIADVSLSEVRVSATITCAGGTQAEAEQRLAAASISIVRGTDRRLTIKPIFPGGERGNDGANVIVRLPDADGIDITTSNGRVTITGLSGSATIHTSNGPVNVIDHRGAVEVETSNGGVTAQRIAGAITIKTSNAAVTLSELGGAAHVTSSNGSITAGLNADQPGPLELHTSNGSINAKVGRAFSGTVKCQTSNGSIKLNDQAGRVKSKQLGKTSGTINVGDGGSPSELSTSNGNIMFEIDG